MPRRTTRPHICCHCGQPAGWVLAFTIQGQLVATLWLCDEHKRAVGDGAWGLAVEPRASRRA